MLRRATVVAAALAVCSPHSVAGDDTSEFRGSGIYRPFNVMRQVKLTTAYLVNLPLPDQVDIAHAYRLSDVMPGLLPKDVKDVADALESGEMRLAVPVDESSGYLTPIRAPWQVRAGSRHYSEAPKCVDWLNALQKERPEVFHEFHVLVEKDLGMTGSGRVVTWNPHEVVEGHFNVPLSSAVDQLR